MDPFSIGTGLAGAASGLYGLFKKKKNPYDEAMRYYGQIPGAVAPYLDPFINQGNETMGGLGDLYQRMFKDPAAFQQQIGEGFKESPGYKFALQEALHAGANQMGAGGMANTPLAQRNQMEIATNLGNQEYQNYLNNVMSTLGLGIQGGENIMGRAYNASSGMGDIMGSNLAQMGNLAQMKQAYSNQSNAVPWSQLAGGLGMAYGGYNY